jgi:hypothetical protein
MSLFLSLLICVMPLFAAKGTYSRSAVSVYPHCDQTEKCPDVLVRSPDGTRSVRLFSEWDKTLREYAGNVEIRTASGHWSLAVPGEWVNFDVLWSPDSKFVALTGNPNGYTESVRVFQIGESGPVRVEAAKASFADMMRRFPPCRARNADPVLCAGHHDEDDLNFAAVAWEDSRTLVLMSEVICSSSQGGIMC